MNDNEKYIEEFVNDIPFDAPGDEHRDELKNQLLNGFPKHRLQPTVKTVNVWRKIMKSSITKTAAAAVIIIAVLIALHLGSGTVTFAQVIEPIITAKTIVLDMLVGDEATSPVMHEIIVGSRIRRTVSNIPDTTSIIDLDNAKMLALNDKDKTAVYVDIQGPLHEGTRIYINFLNNVVIELKDNSDIEKLPEREIDGKKAVGFATSGPNQEDVKIWADPKTALPVRIELRIGQFFAILKNLQFNVQIEDSLVGMEVPPGYKLHQAEFDLTGATEKDFIEGLRIWTRISDGGFPDSIGTEATMKQVPMLTEKLNQLNLSDEETGRLMMTFMRGTLFVQLLETKGKFQYSGNGVKLGDVDKAIFWYQPKDSETYRVIYGDLSVKDVAPENLPE
jgi:hypothetical protein